jgi:hypothetical protein
VTGLRFAHPPEPGLVSVIVPCLNGERYVGDAIRSALAQTHPRVEVLVVDNGSTDASPAIARAFGGAVRVFVEPRRGLPIARNRALGESRGEFVQLLDCDDLLHPDKLSRHVALLGERPDAGVVYGGARFFENSPTGPESVPADFVLGARDYPTALLARNLLPPVAALFRRNVARAIGGFDPALPAGEDWDFWLRAAWAGFGFHFDPAELCYYRRHPGQMTQTGPLMARGVRLVLDKIEDRLRGRELTPAEAQALACAYLRLHGMLAATGDAATPRVESRIDDLVSRARSGGSFVDVAGSELTPVEAIDLAVGVAFLARSRGRSDADAILTDALVAVDNLADVTADRIGAPALERVIDAAFARAVLAEYADWLIPLRAALRRVLRRHAPERLIGLLPLLAIDHLTRPILDRGRLAGWRRIGFYGGGMHTARLLGLVDLGGIEVAGIADDDPGQWGRRIFGVPVMDRQALIDARPDAVVISSDRYEEQIDRRCGPLRDAGIEVVRIYGV